MTNVEVVDDLDLGLAFLDCVGIVPESGSQPRWLEVSRMHVTIQYPLLAIPPRVIRLSTPCL